LLSDFHPHGKVIKSYGLFNDEKGTSFRAVVIVDKGGIIRFKRTYTSVLTPGASGQGIVRSDLDPADILTEVENIQESS
jgi:alkyl hydroperoxide reductase subunit AhpC